MEESQRGAFCVLYMHFLSVVRVWWWGGLHKGVTQKIMHSDWAAIWKEKKLYNYRQSRHQRYVLLQCMANMDCEDKNYYWCLKFVVIFFVLCSLCVCSMMCLQCLLWYWAIPLCSPSRPPSLFRPIALSLSSPLYLSLYREHCLGGRWSVYAPQGI